MTENKLGLIHIYCGDGKGKTTACMGLALRCAGRGNKVLIAQFMKSRDTGEILALKNVANIEIMRGKTNDKFTFQMNEDEKAQTLKEHNELFAKALAKCNKENIDLLILDEVIGACNANVFDYKKVVELMKNKPEKMELAISGRNPKPEFIELADYVSEIKLIKHPFTQGIAAREGIEK
jgi:cob(I)alamin adenosyltransferase